MLFENGESLKRVLEQLFRQDICVYDQVTEMLEQEELSTSFKETHIYKMRVQMQQDIDRSNLLETME